jgi:antitoxin (DNA-binding transcriptional repressor) of toxin-antitoxin stability system
MRTVNAEETKLPNELLNTIADGELVLITQKGNPVAILSPVSITQSAVQDSQTVPLEPQRRLGTATGMFTMSDDFNEPLDDFTAYQKP